MTGETLLFVTVALVFLFLLLWFLREPAGRREAGPPSPPAIHPQIEELVALHCEHLPQIHHVFTREDDEWLRRRAPAPILRRWRAERRQVAREFLAGLGEDFQRLTYLARTVAALSPRLSKQQETELFWLGMRFRALHLLVRARLRLGFSPLVGLTRLTEILGNLAAGIENAMASLEEAALAQLRNHQAGFSSSRPA